jgi:hypothetical protein
MRIAISTIALILLFGSATAAYARQEDRKGQEEQQQSAKPEHKEAKPVQQQAKPAQQQHAQQQAKPQREETEPAEQHAQKQAKPAEQRAKPVKQQQEARPAEQQHAQHGTDSQQHQTQAVNQQQARPANGNNGNYAHGRISDAHYASSFGSGHNFHVNRGEYNSRRFQYGGYSFGFIDPWPAAWGYSDDVYVVYGDGGYYMYDVVHPGTRISINIL